MDPVSALMILAAGGSAVWLGQDWLERRRLAQRAAESLGLEVSGLGNAIEGEVGGHRVRIETVNEASHCVVHPSFAMPEGTDVRTAVGLGAISEWVRADIAIGGRLDPQLTVRGREGELVPLLTEPGVQRALQEIAGAGTMLLGVDRLDVWERGSHTVEAEARIRRALDLVLALEACWVRPWARLRERLDLRDEAVEDSRRLAGAPKGVPLVVQEHRHGRRPMLRVTAQLRVPLPEGSEITGRSAKGALDLRDPILGGRVFASGPESLRERLCRGAVRGPLLELCCDHPESRITQDRIGLVVREAPLDPGPAVELVLALEQALSESAG